MTQEKMNIDKLFKDKLEGISGIPSEKVWEQVNTSLASQGMYHSFLARNKKWAALFVLLIISAGTLWFVFDAPEADKQTEISTTNTSEINSDIQNDDIISPANSNVQNDIFESEQNITPQVQEEAIDIFEEVQVTEPLINEPLANVHGIDAEPAKEQADMEETIISTPAIAVTPEMEPAQEEIVFPETETKPQQREDFQAYHMQNSVNPYFNLAFEYLDQQNLFTENNVQTGVVQISDLTPWKKFSQKPSYLCLGASAGPEYIFYGTDNRNSGVAYGLDLYYNKSGLVLRSGAQMARFGDQGQYDLNYQRVDSLGYMYTVESFTIDPNNPDSVIFNMKIEGVYDSVNVSEQRYTDAYYTYLQIPFMAGYTVAAYGNLSFDISAGPVVNFLVKENNPRPVIPEGDNIFMGEMDNNSDPWIKTNIQLRATIAMHYRFSRRMRLMVEPVYNYYLNPVYTGSIEAESAPYSLGARIGLLYKF
ncbi:MAG: hypothetical protein C0593_07090 [Marinilabiliales bacterium]|nr:MAG: hypothetical protein C0593_07090 [Marinilabiliales bacterium]